MVEQAVATKRYTPELTKALQDAGYAVSHGICDVAAKIMEQNQGTDSGMSTASIRHKLLIRQAEEQGVDKSQLGAAQFHQKVVNLIEEGAKPSEVRQMLERIRDSYPSNDLRAQLAQDEINWVSQVPPDALVVAPQSLN